MADEQTTQAQEEQQVTTSEVVSILFEDIVPWVESGGDTGLSARLKLKRNFEKIKAWMDGSGFKFLSRLYDDTAWGHITFTQGLTALARIVLGDYATGTRGGQITEEGSAELHDLWVRAVAWLDRIESRNYSGEGVFDRGMAAWIDERGDSHGIIDYLTVRKKWYAWLLEIRELSYVGGDYVFSAAGSRILHVEWYDANGSIVEPLAVNLPTVSYFRCWFYSNDGTTRTMNYWRADDQARCHTDDTVEVGLNEQATNKDYWRRVVAVGRCAIPTLDASDQNYGVEMEYADLSKADCDPNSQDVPEADDKIVQIGNWTDTDRQSLMELQVTGEGAPAFRIYHGVGANGQHFVMPEATTVLSPHGNVIRGQFISEAGQGAGDTIEERLQSLLLQINDIRGQADQKIDTWFGQGAPTPNENAPSAAANAPASNWTTIELKTLHAGDIYYDENHEAADQNGGRAWRWEAVDNGSGDVGFVWKDITDADTREALEKVGDVASDGKLTGGAEKTRVLMDWRWETTQLLRYGKQYWSEKDTYDASKAQRQQGQDFADFDAAWTQLSTAWADYLNAFMALGQLLNGGTDISITYRTEGGTQKEPTAVGTPAWLADLSTTTEMSSADAYRSAWNTYYEKLGLLARAFAARDGEQVQVPYGVTATLENTGTAIIARVTGMETTIYGDGGTAANPTTASLIVKLGAVETEVQNARGTSASLSVRLNGIESTVTSNQSAAATALTNLEARIHPDVLKTNDAYEYATWKSQTDTNISNLAAKFDQNGGLVAWSSFKQSAESIISEVQNARGTSTSLNVRLNGIESTVTSNQSAAATALTNLEARIHPDVLKTNDAYEYATWKSQTDTDISNLAAKFDQNGGLVAWSSFKQSAESIISEVQNARGNETSLGANLSELWDYAEDIDDEQEASATWISQNKNKWSVVAASFDSNGNVTASGKVGLYVQNQLSSFEVDADQIDFKTGNFNISNGSKTTFSVDSSGNVYLAGELHGGNITGDFTVGQWGSNKIMIYADDWVTNGYASGIRGGESRSSAVFDLGYSVVNGALSPFLTMKRSSYNFQLSPFAFIWNNGTGDPFSISYSSGTKLDVHFPYSLLRTDDELSSITKGTLYIDGNGNLKVKNT